MKRKIFLIVAMSAVVLTACRQESDQVMNYAYKDQMAFGAAENSYSAKFDVLWHGMNTNYALWDFEEEHGLDWDKVYDVYRPKFVELDSMKTAVTDAQLKALLDSVVAPLHDGHLMVSMQNHATGKFVYSSPSALRLMRERQEEFLATASRKMNESAYTYYRNAGQIIEEKHVNTNSIASIITPIFDKIDQIKKALEEKETQGTITPAERDTLVIYTEIYAAIQQAVAKAILGNTKEAIEAYNIVAYRYEYLHIPGLVPADPKLAEYGLELHYILFKDNIAYLTFDGFMLSAYMEPQFTQILFGTPSESTQAMIDSVKATWKAWFDAIQIHHQAGDLGGVILDVRSNGGGFLNDFKFVLGALVPSGNFHDANARCKRGTGRYDYSPIMEQYMPTYEDEHVTVTEPIVTLCNCGSVSMAEHTSYGTKVLPNGNGTLIGTRTHGGFSALSSSESFTENYAGYVGILDETPVFCYIPQEVAMTLDNEIIEGIGVTPDIEVTMDFGTWNSGAGPDNQLDKALGFIKSK